MCDALLKRVRGSGVLLYWEGTKEGNKEESERKEDINVREERSKRKGTRMFEMRIKGKREGRKSKYGVKRECKIL